MMLFLATQLPTLQQALLTTSLSAQQWLQCVLLAAALPIVVEISKAVRRHRSAPASTPGDVRQAVTPERAQTATERPPLSGEGARSRRPR